MSLEGSRVDSPLVDPVEAAVGALEREIDEIRERVRGCVDRLAVPDPATRYLLLERLPRLGSAVIAPALALARDEAVEREVRVAAALLALHEGDSSAADLVLDAIARRGRLAMLGARLLATQRVESAAPVLVEAIRSTPATEVDYLVAYLFALRDLGAPLPADQRARLLAEAPWQVTTAIEEAFPDA
jgi:hypothetical protein